MLSPTKSGTNLLEVVFSKNAALQAFIAERDSLNIQVIYTRIDRNSQNVPGFTTYTFNSDSPAYFYPASTIKMPIAFLALEKLNSLTQFQVDRNTTMITNPSINGMPPYYKFDTVGTVAKYVEEIFLVSDNEAFNRLYEFLGQEYIQQQLFSKGFADVKVRHGLSIALSDEQNRATNAVRFLDKGGSLLYSQQPKLSSAQFTESDIQLGKGYYANGNLVNNPFDFSLKNAIKLSTLHTILQAMIFPGATGNPAFQISGNNREFLLRCMSAYPGEAITTKYNQQTYPATYVKFLLDGLVDKPAFPHIRCFNKSGLAYGFLTDVAYFVDFENNIEYLLSATILSNKNQVFNDDHYDFETIGFPFMRLLSSSIYELELSRKYKNVPNLAEFKFDY